MAENCTAASDYGENRVCTKEIVMELTLNDACQLDGTAKIQVRLGNGLG